MVLWDVRSPSFWSAGFPNKIAIPCPNMLPLDLLAHCMVSSMSLYSVQIFGDPKMWPHSENFRYVFSSCQDHLSWGPTVQISPKWHPPALVTGSWIRESTFGNQCAPRRRVSHSSVYSWKLYFPSVWGFCFRISQFVLYLSEVFCWREERAVGLSPDVWTCSFLWMLVFVCTESCLYFCLFKNGEYFSYL